MGGKLTVVLVSTLIQQEWQALAPEGVSVCFYDECGSTNALAAERGSEGFDHPTWFVASKQTNGRGRRGRTWLSKNGNLFSSLLTHMDVDMGALATLPYVIALAVRDTFVDLGCSPEWVQCKWPNDVLINEKKASGILIESSAGDKGTVDFIVIGIGLNLAHFPSDAQFPATSLARELDTTIAPSKAFRSLAHNLNSRLEIWTPNDVGALIREWISFSWGLNQRRMIQTASESFMATLNGLDEKGGLDLVLDDGTKRKMYAGDVFAAPNTH